MKNKKLLLALGLLFVIGSFGRALAAPDYTFQRSLLPQLDSRFYLGTTTPSTNAWAGVITDQLCLTGDSCRTTWPSGSGSAFPFTPVSYGNATSTTLGFLNGFLSTASSTVFADLRLPLLGTAPGSFLAVDPTGLIISTTTPGGVSNIATTYPILGGPITTTGTLSLAFGTSTSNTWGGTQSFTNAANFNDWTNNGNGTTTTLSLTGLANAPLLSTNSIGRISAVASGSGGQILSWLSGVPTWTATTTFSSPLIYEAGNVTCQTASGSLAGCLSAADWTTFNNKGSGTVTSVDMTVPTGLSVSGNPITTSGTLALTFTSGYSIPTNAKQTSWDNKWDLASTTIAVPYGGTGATTLTGLLQGNGTSAISGIGGTIGQIPYFNGTNTVLATSTVTVSTASNVGIGSTTPSVRLSVGSGTASSTAVVAEYAYGKPGNLATSTSQTIDGRTSTQVQWPIGTSATTLTLCNLIPGQVLRIRVVNPGSTAGALTFATCSGTQLYWADQGAMPTQVTTANHWDYWSFAASESVASTTNGVIMVSGSKGGY